MPGIALGVPPLSDLSVRRTLKGSSQTHGELSVVVRNNRPVHVRAHYVETMPWHVEFFLHTLSVTCGDRGTECGACSVYVSTFVVRTDVFVQGPC